MTSTGVHQVFTSTGDPFHREITHFELVPCVYVLMYVWQNGKSLHSVVSLDAHPAVYESGHSPPPNPRLHLRFCTALRADRAERSLFCWSIMVPNGMLAANTRQGVCCFNIAVQCMFSNWSVSEPSCPPHVPDLLS